MTETGRLAAKKRRVSGDRDGFRDSTKIELQVQPDGLACGEPYPVARQCAESAQLDPNTVGSRSKTLNHVDAVVTGHDRSRSIGSRIDDRDRRAGNDRARLIHDPAGESATADLRISRAHGSGPQKQ